MSDKENDKLDKILQRLDDHSEDLETIKRGIYGDEKNGVIGLLKENQDQEKRIKSLEDFKKKGTAIVTGFTLSWPIIWANIRQYFGL